MKFLTKLGLAGIVVAATAYVASTLPFSVYQLHKTEYAVEKRFGDIVSVKSKPGPYLKNDWYKPSPLIIPNAFFTSVEKLDRRIQEYVDSSESVMTKDHKFIALSRYCKWIIEDPVKYVNAVRTPEKAQTLLDDIVFARVWEKNRGTLIRRKPDYPEERNKGRYDQNSKRAYGKIRNEDS